MTFVFTFAKTSAPRDVVARVRAASALEAAHLFAKQMGRPTEDAAFWEGSVVTVGGVRYLVRAE